MARKSQHKYQGLYPVGGHYSAHQGSTTGDYRVDAIVKAKTIEQFIAPVFNFPFTATYAKELELSDFEDLLEPDAEITTQTKTQDPKYHKLKNKIQYSHATIVRPWDPQFHIQRGECIDQNQTVFAVWEQDTPLQEPLNDVGEVASESADRRQTEGYCWMARSRGCRFHIPQ